MQTLICSCCGGSAKGKQWHNRDTGYGLCTKCVPFVIDRTAPEVMESSYGIEGIHYFAPEKEKTLPVPQEVKRSEFGCNNCLWNSIECKSGSKYKPAADFKDCAGKTHATCDSYTYYD